MDKQEQIQQFQDSNQKKMPLEDFLKLHPDITIQEAMDKGYSYEEIIFG